MEETTIKLPKQLVNNIKLIVDKTKLYKNEQDFIEQAIIKQITKYK